MTPAVCVDHHRLLPHPGAPCPDCAAERTVTKADRRLARRRRRSQQTSGGAS